MSSSGVNSFFKRGCETYVLPIIATAMQCECFKASVRVFVMMISSCFRRSFVVTDIWLGYWLFLDECRCSLMSVVVLRLRGRDFSPQPESKYFAPMNKG